MSIDRETMEVLENVAERAAQQAVHETLVSLGLDPKKPIEVQRDMAALRELREMMTSREFQADMMHLRRWRKSMDAVQSKGMLTLVGLITAGLAAALWIGFQRMLK